MALAVFSYPWNLLIILVAGYRIYVCCGCAVESPTDKDLFSLQAALPDRVRDVCLIFIGLSRVDVTIARLQSEKNRVFGGVVLVHAKAYTGHVVASKSMRLVEYKEVAVCTCR